MSWIPAVASVLTGATSGYFQGLETQEGLQSQADATQQGVNLQRDQWEQTLKDQAPWLSAGKAALPRLSQIAGNVSNIDPRADIGYQHKTSLTDPGQFNFSTTGPNADPSYTWRLNQGLTGVNSSAAARGGFFSGNTGVALNNYAQEAASTEYQAQFGRYQNMLNDYMNQETFNSDQYNLAYNRQMGLEENQFNQYASIAGLGQTALNQMQVSGQNYANNSGNLAINQSNNSANASMNQANIWANVAANASNQFSSEWPSIYKQISKPTNSGGAEGPAY